MNRHALICQVQRLVMSIKYLLWGQSSGFGSIDMSHETTLSTDPPNSMERTINVNPPIADGDVKEPQLSEKWIFINGIAGEVFWLRLSCQKLARHFRRSVTGVFNRGDGLLWDVIECAGERTDEGRSSTSQINLIKRTESSVAAQKKLQETLIGALNQNHERVVVIAHSQGCLILRLSLDGLLQESEDIREKMLSRLCVFTFASPSLNWNVYKSKPTRLAGHARGVSMEHLSSHVHITEHFANKTDFVAKLGVLHAPSPDNGYVKTNVFINKSSEWIGHLFGTQYSLDPDDYVSGRNSALLKCAGGRQMPSRGEF
jgi:hypothetical protein